ncbi:hypothetical protein AVEN_6590-1 [Araneus ventricosus]|uniref:Uncharacterized protein n=1 Tax=Araneus ventricosus TaxID=182803 RepID=A0A4Y2LL17_ARAVE|nr:hypothetical protein AVEN_6590-1 [Araneus ventricosus]
MKEATSGRNAQRRCRRTCPGCHTVTLRTLQKTSRHEPTSVRFPLGTRQQPVILTASSKPIQIRCFHFYIVFFTLVVTNKSKALGLSGGDSYSLQSVNKSL